MYRVYTITIYDIRKYTIRVYTTTALIRTLLLKNFYTVLCTVSGLLVRVQCPVQSRGEVTVGLGGAQAPPEFF